ncbi:HAMP domain-containing sensor histidine kinase [Paenibacillus sp. LHD-117]|uniref:HAMP domain-containing sensor histidine kinase n=1 Tax=Paenibacillus sp. LHD-117 TaxID=3071412 RepID=UPI0027E13536|nr:HAMP domain-containing sensor histidine kinase [Paenibacillus sp. LHD-117]MDQ6420142.1 HAMP domain-containing sensor histidine kinase [Paenibacillus sp. LHD-117]
MDRKLVKQTSILSYWTARYFIILCIGLLVLAAAAVWWTKQQTMDSRLQTVELLAQDIADRLSGTDGTVVVPPDLTRLLQKRSQYFRLGPGICLIVTDMDGKLLYASDPLTQEDLPNKLNADLDQAREPGIKAIIAPITYLDEKIGQVTILQPIRPLTQLHDVQWAFGLSFVCLALLGWLTIYLLSRKLSRPIRKVASAARAISQGRYDVRLDEQTKERELGELLHSFKEMAARLKQLEHSRSFMLAGLTHELKTPVTSVKGLIFAVKEKVVQQEEADEFLDIALQESWRLERMVADLLDYNSLAAGVVRLDRHRLNANALLDEIVYQWKLLQGDRISEPVLSLPEQTIFIQGDSLRIQQIVVNLLNNSMQAKHPDHPLHIEITLTGKSGMAEITVCDNGTGIPESEQHLVFERFFRGENKKHAIRGLGLGLAFSKLLAQAQQGDLSFNRSTEQGTSFSITLPIAPPS